MANTTVAGCKAVIITTRKSLFFTSIYIPFTDSFFSLLSPESTEEASALVNSVGIFAKRMLGKNIISFDVSFVITLLNYWFWLAVVTICSLCGIRDPFNLPNARSLKSSKLVRWWHWSLPVDLAWQTTVPTRFEVSIESEMEFHLSSTPLSSHKKIILLLNTQ